MRSPSRALQCDSNLLKTFKYSYLYHLESFRGALSPKSRCPCFQSHFNSIQGDINTHIMMDAHSRSEMADLDLVAVKSLARCIPSTQCSESVNYQLEPTCSMPPPGKGCNRLCRDRRMLFLVWLPLLSSIFWPGISPCQHRTIAAIKPLSSNHR